MKKRVLAVMLALSLVAGLSVGCDSGSNNTGSDSTKKSSSKETTAEDQEKADEVADMIDAIYVQEYTDDTPELCRKAKEGWDKLTDAQKELVEGEYADPDYFGLDTGDASKDDPLNADEIGENELLVVSFGTSFNDSRVEDIGGIEKALAEANPDMSVRRAFTSQIIINHILSRDDESIDNVEQALDRAVNNGVKNLVVAPTHLMQGAEYDELVEKVTEYAGKFETVKIADPLLGKVGKDESDTNEDKKNVANAIVHTAAKSAGYDNFDKADKDQCAIVLMGHGTSHNAKITYTQMQTVMNDLGFKNVFIGTVEGEPEETACETIIEAVNDAGYNKVVLRPLMVVAGDHANNDMAGDDQESWKSNFGIEFDDVECQIEGMGRIEAIENVYKEHVSEARESDDYLIKAEGTASSGALEDGTYNADFTTDSSMFHVNDVYGGKGVLTVADGKMTMHITLVSKNIVNLYLGTAEEAEGDEANWLQPTTDTVEYEDGTTEEVYGFDVPVESLGEEFDLAIIGTKGKWYDHKVSVSNPEPTE